MTPPLISLEEHFYSRAVFETLPPHLAEGKFLKGILSQLQDVDVKRIAAMDAGNIALQVISHAWAPGSVSVEACREGNNELAERIARSKNRRRLAAFAILPISSPQDCAAELERSVKEDRFVGVLINNTFNGQYFDTSEYDALWAKAQELDVPIYLHPAPTSMEFPSNISPMAAWGWHQDVGLHILRLYASGVFDRFPCLKIILGHMGEMLPFMLERINNLSSSEYRSVEDSNGIKAERKGWGLKRTFKDVYDTNIWITTSGFWSLAPMRCILQNTKIERVLYSVDWPFECNKNALKWFQELEKTGWLSGKDLEKIAFRNAESLLRVRAPTMADIP